MLYFYFRIRVCMPCTHSDLVGGEIVQTKLVKITDQILLGILGAKQGNCL